MKKRENTKIKHITTIILLFILVFLQSMTHIGVLKVLAREEAALVEIIGGTDAANETSVPELSDMSESAEAKEPVTGLAAGAAYKWISASCLK